MFEKDECLNARARDWNMGLHWGAKHLEALLSEDAWSRIQSVQTDPNVPMKAYDLRFLNAQTGEEMGSTFIEPHHRLRRSKVRQLLVEGVPVQYGKHFSGATFDEVEGTVTARFDDGTSAHGRLLVGADGSHSAVRSSLLPPGSDGHAMQRLPFCATFAQATYTREQAMFLRSFHPLYLAGIHPDNKFCFFGMQNAEDAEHPENWVFFLQISVPCSIEEQEAMTRWSNEQHLQQAKKHAEGCSEPWKSAFAWMPDGNPVWAVPLADWDPKRHPWNNHGGLATIVGDAAHTMTFQRGQGLNHSITDAAELLGAIQSFLEQGKKQEDAVNAFEKEMVDRAGAEVRMSTLNTGMLHEWSKAIQSPFAKYGLRKQEQE